MWIYKCQLSYVFFLPIPLFKKFCMTIFANSYRKKWQKRKQLNLVGLIVSCILGSGSVLSSQLVSKRVLSALKGLTSVFGMGTGGSPSLLPPEIFIIFLTSAPWLPHKYLLCYSALSIHSRFSWSSPRPISTSQLHALLHFHPWPIYLIVFEGPYFLRMGSLILKGASRLDAFSVYPVRTSLPGYALGSATGAPEVRPSRSSRTRDSSSQTSCAHSG